MMVMTSFTADPGAPRVSAHKSFHWRPQYLLGAVLLLLLAGGVYGIINIVSSKAPPRMKQIVQQISLLPPPPPPVDQPPQPEIKEEVNIPPPQPVAQDNAPPGDLGMDADGNGSDNFQLRARKGGRSLLDSNPFSSFANRIQESIYKTLSADKRVRSANYVVTVKLWLGQDGRIERFELANSTGDQKLDQSIKLALAKVGPLGDEIPPDLPQPVRLQITSRQ